MSLFYDYVIKHVNYMSDVTILIVLIM